MRKLALAIALMFSGAAVFAANYGSAGCGLGSLAFPQDEAFPQILAATTNGTFGSQTFGITFGTSNCSSEGLVKLSKERDAFIEANYRDLAKDIAMGKGQFVDNLSKLYGYTSKNSSVFVSQLQKNYTKIFASNNVKVAITEINKVSFN
ncbi:MAG: DUF3015 family protein [Elusimicrobiota bacterium]|nr:DUF3015 family protein [Elusimicrobiota bacterium]